MQLHTHTTYSHSMSLPNLPVYLLYKSAQRNFWTS